ncbi:MAG: M48 family metallopeptidase [Bryobacteraceae bacterium]
MRNLLSHMVCVLLFTSGFSYGQLSRLDEVDQRLAVDRNQKILSSTVIIPDPEIDKQLKNIAERIARTSYFSRYAFPPRIFYLGEPIVNAMSGGAGLVYVFNGLVRVVQNNGGILAFVVGHEMAHNCMQHAAKTYLRRVAFEAEYRRLRSQDPRSALAYKVAWYITEKKIERDQENEADRLGLRAAAQAGYHPDYAILAARALRQELPYHSKFVTFFYLNHPRWITREERTEKSYTEALGIFETFWPNAAASPGGTPPPLAIVAPVAPTRWNQA